MKAITIEDALNYPSLYMISDDIAEYADYYGKYMTQCYIQAYVNFEYNSYYVANVANMTLYGALGFVLLVALLIRFMNYLATSKRLPKPLLRFQTVLVKYFYLSSGAGTKSTEPVRWLGQRATWASIQIPTRLHSIAVSVYVVFCIGIMFGPYEALYPSLYWQEIGYPILQYTRFFADRTGIMSFGSTPLVIVLAGRNNPIAYITGASYSTLQIYHRWIARMCYFHGFAHGVAWTVEEYLNSSVTDNYLKTVYDNAYWNWGCAALGGGALLCFFSFRRMRELSYELFLIGHILGAILWIVGCYYHVWLLEKDWYPLKFIYAAIALWAFDRVARLVRMFFLSIPQLFRSSSSGGKKNAIAAEGHIVGTGDYVRLRVTMARPWPSILGGGPGSYVFISSLNHNVWESHPFTITWPTGMPAMPPSTVSTPEALADGETKSLGASSGPGHDFEHDGSDNDRTFELVLRSYSGFTQKIYNALGVAPDGGEAGERKKQAFKLFVDGPYGKGVNLHKGFETILLVSGGSGISATVAHLADLAKHFRKGDVAVKRVVLVWAVRDMESFGVIIPYLTRLQDLLPSTGTTPFLHLEIYYTGDTQHLKSTLPSSSDPEKRNSSSDNGSFSSSLTQITSLFKPVRPSFATISTREGRPLIGEHIDALEEFVGGGIAVSSCGPVGLVDQSRIAVRDRLGTRGFDAATLSYSEESFTW